MTQLIVYGPVKSRRLGQSLGINLTPEKVKVCNFNCGYCRVGVSSKAFRGERDFVLNGLGLGDVISGVTKGVKHHADKGTHLDSITFAGNGEPTLYPWFVDVVEEVIGLRDQYFPDKPVSIFTNSTAETPEIREAIFRTDRRFFKLDAGDEQSFRRTNIPLGVKYERIINNLSSLDQDFELSIAVTQGAHSNYGSFFNNRFIENLRGMRFSRIFLYDIDIPVTTSPLFNFKSDKKSLEDLARYLCRELDIKINRDVVILWDERHRNENLGDYPIQLS